MTWEGIGERRWTVRELVDRVKRFDYEAFLDRFSGLVRIRPP